MSDERMTPQELGAATAEDEAAPAIGRSNSRNSSNSSSKTQRQQRVRGRPGRESDGDASSQHTEQSSEVDLTQTPQAAKAALRPIVVDDTPMRQEEQEGQERSYVGLTATTPRPDSNLKRVTTLERDFELARRLQDEEENGAPLDEDMLFARHLQVEEDEGLAIQLAQSARERTSPPAVAAEFIHGLLNRHQRPYGGDSDEDGFDDDDDHYDRYDDSDGDDADADEAEAMHRMPFMHAPMPRHPNGRYQPPVRVRGRGAQRMPNDPHLRELMTRDIDPNDYETLLQLDEQKKNKQTSKQVNQLIRNLPRYQWPDKTTALTGKLKRQASVQRPAASKRRRSQSGAERAEGQDISSQPSRGKRRRKQPTEDDKDTTDDPTLEIENPAAQDAPSTTLASSSASSTSSSQPTQPSPPSTQTEAEACPICLEQFSDGQVVCVTPCDSLHTFHETCIKHWLRVKAECPIDKHQLL